MSCRLRFGKEQGRMATLLLLSHCKMRNWLKALSLVCYTDWVLSLPFLQHQSSDLILGRTGPFRFFPSYRVPERARSAHMYIIGITGKGKSKLLENCIVQDIQAKRSCILIDPHSDLVGDVLHSCVSRGVLSLKDAERVIYFEPTHQEGHTLSFNVLAGP